MNDVPNETSFRSLVHAREQIAAWKEDFGRRHHDASPDMPTPHAFAARSATDPRSTTALVIDVYWWRRGSGPAMHSVRRDARDGTDVRPEQIFSGRSEVFASPAAIELVNEKDTRNGKRREGGRARPQTHLPAATASATVASWPASRPTSGVKERPPVRPSVTSTSARLAGRTFCACPPRQTGAGQ